MKLSINIDHIATLRNARRGKNPDPIQAAIIAELAGADGIVVHLREDRRHIHDRDVYFLREVITTKLDLEMAATSEIVKIACDVKPDLVTLVPEKREELTTEGGLNVIDNIDHLSNAIKELHSAGIPVSLFIEPENNQIEASLDVGADFIEIHTGKFANLLNEEEKLEELERIRLAAKYAKKYKLGVNAGHGLDYNNIKLFRELENIDEVSIGHSIIARAALVGLERAVKEMLQLINYGY
ncbi:MAG TPA: pyridoxine 5'-phosphate synthase [Ignavibacteriales bacterium]|jgi:pyridoxine 5-phosphate synthase|nr:pyridoxine 5'-phosphate synthase [Ignavibacteriales bacterium]